MDWMKWLHWADEAKGWIGGAVGGLGGLWLKYRAARRSELEQLVNQLQEECNRKGIQVAQLDVLVRRLQNNNNYQRLEIFLHNRSRKDTISDLRLALQSVRDNTADCEIQIERAINRLSEDIVVPDDIPQPESNQA